MIEWHQLKWVPFANLHKFHGAVVQVPHRPYALGFLVAITDGAPCETPLHHGWVYKAAKNGDPAQSDTYGETLLQKVDPLTLRAALHLYQTDEPFTPEVTNAPKPA